MLGTGTLAAGLGTTALDEEKSSTEKAIFPLSVMNPTADSAE